MKFADVVLNEDEMEQVEAEVEVYSQGYQQANGFPMSARERNLVRQKVAREFKEGIWANRDYCEFDAGEEPKSREDY